MEGLNQVLVIFLSIIFTHVIVRVFFLKQRKIKNYLATIFAILLIGLAWKIPLIMPAKTQLLVLRSIALLASLIELYIAKKQK